MKLNITWKIFIGMALGIFVGYFIHNHFDLGQFSLQKDATITPEQGKANDSVKEFSSYLQLLSKIFLRMIQMILGPLVFSILTVGVAKLGDFKVVGRIGIKTLGYFYFATILSLITGLVAVNIKTR